MRQKSQNQRGKFTICEIRQGPLYRQSSKCQIPPAKRLGMTLKSTGAGIATKITIFTSYLIFLWISMSFVRVFVCKVPPGAPAAGQELGMGDDSYVVFSSAGRFRFLAFDRIYQQVLENDVGPQPHMFTCTGCSISLETTLRRQFPQPSEFCNGDP